MLRSIIDHKKVFVLALNGPAVGGGAAWFTGISDIVLASSSCYLQVPFSALGLVPENGSAINFAQSMGIQYVLPFLHIVLGSEFYKRVFRVTMSRIELPNSKLRKQLSTLRTPIVYMLT
jgi:enoyl-CoA hydratase/carnithine racemase